MLSTPDGAGFDIEECAAFTVLGHFLAIFYNQFYTGVFSQTTRSQKVAYVTRTCGSVPPLQHWSTCSSFILKIRRIRCVICGVSLRRWGDAALLAVGTRGSRVLLRFCCQVMVLLQLRTEQMLN